MHEDKSPVKKFSKIKQSEVEGLKRIFGKIYFDSTAVSVLVVGDDGHEADKRRLKDGRFYEGCYYHSEFFNLLCKNLYFCYYFYDLRFCRFNKLFLS